MVLRRSARIADVSSSPPKDDDASVKTGSKRKAANTTSPKGKRSKKVQKTIEEFMPEEKDTSNDVEMQEATAKGEGTHKKTGEVDDVDSSKAKESNQVEAEQKVEELGTNEEKASTEANGSSSVPKKEQNGDGPKEEKDSMAKSDDKAAPERERELVSNGTKPNDANGHFVEKSAEREKKVPSNIIEKGIIYFFTRGRVGIEEPESVQDLQRSYFVMRPIPKGAELSDGAIDNAKANRLVALPKKVFPKSGRDRFMAFVEKSKASMKELREEFFQGSEYETKTTGTRQTPPVAPIGEGVYAITQTGRTTHLAYILTIPEKPDQVQEDMGLREKGSFILSLKNPTRKGPVNAQLPKGPGFPKEIIEDFRGLAWMGVSKPEYLDYPNAQILLVGESQDKFGGAVEATEKDKKADKESPEEELEKLEDEDQLRIDHLHGEDSVFDDLHISKKEYPPLFLKW